MTNIKVTDMKTTAEKSVNEDEDVVSLLRQKVKNYMNFASHLSQYPSQPSKVNLVLESFGWMISELNLDIKGITASSNHTWDECKSHQPKVGLKLFPEMHCLIFSLNVKKHLIWISTKRNRILMPFYWI